MGTNPKVCFLGGMGRSSLVVSQGRKVGFLKKIQGLIFFVVCNRVVGKKGGYYLFCV